MDWMKWFPIIGPVLGAIARAIIEGSKEAGVTHETVALTIAKTIMHLQDGVNARTAQTAAPPSPPQP